MPENADSTWKHIKFEVMKYIYVTRDWHTCQKPYFTKQKLYYSLHNELKLNKDDIKMECILPTKVTTIEIID